MCSELQAVAQRGLTVVVGLEAPTQAAYGLLDRVLLLMEGRAVYSGTPGVANQHDRSHNPIARC